MPIGSVTQTSSPGALIEGHHSHLLAEHGCDHQVADDQRRLRPAPLGQLAAVLLLEVLLPDDLLRGAVDAQHVAEGTDRVHVRLGHRRNGARAGVVEAAGRVVGVTPDLLAAFQVEDAQHVLLRGDAIQQVDLSVDDGRTGVARTERGRPGDRRSLGREGADQSGLGRAGVAQRAGVVRPVLRLGGGRGGEGEERQAAEGQQRGMGHGCLRAWGSAQGTRSRDRVEGRRPAAPSELRHSRPISASNPGRPCRLSRSGSTRANSATSIPFSPASTRHAMASSGRPSRAWAQAWL